VSHQPRKRFSQNFLRDEGVIFNIVAAIGPHSDEHLVEIGPGQGALTRFLLAECLRLDVVELDRDLVELLTRKFAGCDNLYIHSGDALRFDFCSLSQGERLRIVGNLPYNISTPLLFRLFEQADCIKDMYFMLQKEVVERLCAKPGDKSYGRLSIMAQYHCRMESLMDVYPESFYPRPKVLSSVVLLVPHAERLVDIPPQALDRVVVAAFGQRRKTLRNSLGNLFSEDEIRDLGLDPHARAETLDLYDYARLGRLALEKNAGV
jgi:16S rRNA (adenine1518-N6/adenine1519-N6)-dimethyltransferase